MWADRAIESLRYGQDTVIYPKGNSMQGRIESGQKVTLTQPTDLKVDDIVLVWVKGKVYLHLIKEINGKYLIGNNKGGINGWVDKDKIYGKVKSIG